MPWSVPLNSTRHHLSTPISPGGDSEISGLGLLSYRKPTKQSSVGWGGIPSRAVDGNIDGHYGHKSCMHSKHGKGKNNWWQVDLQGRYPVYLVLLHNRWDCCQNRINGAEVYLDNYKCGYVEYYRGVAVYPINCGGKTGRVVKVVQRHNFLTLAEVQVFGTGGPGLSVPNFGTGNVMLLSHEKKATQSSVGWGGIPGRAVDGKTDGIYGHR